MGMKQKTFSRKAAKLAKKGLWINCQNQEVHIIVEVAEERSRRL